MNNVGSKLMSKNQDHQDILHQTSLKIQRDSFLEVKKKKAQMQGFMSVWTALNILSKLSHVFI